MHTARETRSVVNMRACLRVSFIIEACHMPCTVVGCHLLCSGLCLARGVVLQLFVQTYHWLLSAFWHFYKQCLCNSFRQVIWLECESKFQCAETCEKDVQQ